MIKTTPIQKCAVFVMLVSGVIFLSILFLSLLDPLPFEGFALALLSLCCLIVGMIAYAYDRPIVMSTAQPKPLPAEAYFDATPIPEPDYVPQYVYVIKGPQGSYKIGFTRNWHNRRHTFGVELPFDIDPVNLIRCRDGRKLEKDLHKRFAVKRIRGEWFRLNAADLEYIQEIQDNPDLKPGKQAAKWLAENPDHGLTVRDAAVKAGVSLATMQRAMEKNVTPGDKE